MERLRRKTEIERAFEKGRRFYSPWVALQACQRQPEADAEAGPRLAVVAGKRFRGSVERNRARRLLRETCRIALGESQARWDLILIARVEVLDIPFAERLRVLDSLLRQAGVLSEGAEAA